MFGKTIDHMFRNKLEHAFTFIGNLKYRKILSQAKENVFWFLCVKNRFQIKLRQCVKSMLYIQRKFNIRKLIFNAKLEILMNSWDKLMGQLYSIKTKIKDKKLLKIINQIPKIKLEIKKYALSEYLKSCHVYHYIAFLQWRYLWPSKLKPN